ncbi:MAG TPA: SDR family oxidoreductase [Lysobacter sp.]
MKAPILVVGATGVVGRGVVEAAVDTGRPVIAVAPDASALENLHAAYPDADITPLTGTVASEADAAQLADRVQALRRPLAGVVTAIGGIALRGRLLDQSVEALAHKIDEDLLPQLAAARHLLPLLANGNRGGSYVLIGDPGSEHPWAGYGHRSITAAALRMLACVLHDEARGIGVRVQLLAPDAPVCADPHRAHECPQRPTALAIGRRAVTLIERADPMAPASAVVPWSARAKPGTKGERGRPDLTLDSLQAAASSVPVAASHTDAIAHSQAPDSQVTDSDASLLPARCLQDVRKLLETFNSKKPHKEQNP